MISTISVHEVTAAMYTTGAIDGCVFIHFLEHYLAPKLQRHHWVILDNVAFHKVKGVKEIIESTGAKVKYLPPYSPDLSPIELMWSKVKSYLKALEARCQNTFTAAMHEAFMAVNSGDLRGWYKNCGYSGSIII